MRLSDIAVRVEAASGPGGLGDGVSALLHEIAGLLERLADSGESQAIDLHSLPLAPHDRARLKAALGEGEVQALMHAGGQSTFRETAIAGVWWVEHRNARDQLVAEQIEVAGIPQILATTPAEWRRGALALRHNIAHSPDGAAQGSSYEP